MKINILTGGLLAAMLFSYSDVCADSRTEIPFYSIVTADTPPVAIADQITTAQNTPAIISVTANDTPGSAPIDPQSVRLIDPFTGAPILAFTIVNQGTYTVNQADGTIIFTPVNSFGGVPPTINYTVKDINGVESNQAKITVTVTPTPPTAVPDVATTTEGKPVSMKVWQNDISGSIIFDFQMVKLIDPVSGQRVFSVTIPNEGTFAVNYFTGVVTFTPIVGFVGVSSVNYDIQDLNGEFSNQAAITITVNADPLPVTLSIFKVEKEGNAAKLFWETTEETNSDRFEIEHSISGKDWNKIGTVDSHGDSKVKNAYNYTDTNPANGGPSNGENLYRLKMIDRDATSAYSRIQRVKFDGLGAPSVSVYPNPSTDKVFVHDMDLTQVKQVSILDMNGCALFSSNKVTADGINVSKFNAGTYILHITNVNGTVSNHKIVIGK